MEERVYLSSHRDQWASWRGGRPSEPPSVLWPPDVYANPVALHLTLDAKIPSLPTAPVVAPGGLPTRPNLRSWHTSRASTWLIIIDVSPR